MNIAIINTETTGGAATAALRLHQGLRSNGIASDFITRNTTSIEDNIFAANVVARPLHTRAASYLMRKAGFHQSNPYNLTTPNRHTQCELFSDCRSPTGKQIRIPADKYDIINLHWVAHFIDWESIIKQHAGRTPIVWTLHDMNPLTGGCHYDSGCGRFISNCHSCPHLNTNYKKDPAADIFKFKSKILSKLADNQLHIVTPSRWLGDLAKKSKLFSRFTTTIIPYGIDTNQYTPIPTASAREAIGIPTDSQVILFIAENIANFRKGFDLLKDAIEQMSVSRHLTLLSVGKGNYIPIKHKNCQSIHLGPIHNIRLLSATYSCADAFVIPSREDNFPNTVLESLSCGTPVIGFNIGGIPDMIVPNETGWIAPKTTSQQLSNTITTALDDLSNKTHAALIRRRCREYALKNFHINKQSLSYTKLYKTLINN